MATATVTAHDHSNIAATEPEMHEFASAWLLIRGCTAIVKRPPNRKYTRSQQYKCDLHEITSVQVPILVAVVAVAYVPAAAAAAAIAWQVPQQSRAKICACNGHQSWNARVCCNITANPRFYNRAKRGDGNGHWAWNALAHISLRVPEPERHEFTAVLMRVTSYTRKHHLAMALATYRL